MLRPCPGCGKEMCHVEEPMCPYCGAVLDLSAYNDEREDQAHDELVDALAE